MELFGIFIDGELKNDSGIEINVNQVPRIENATDFFEKARFSQNSLYNYSVDDLIDFFVRLSELWNSKGHFIQKYRQYGLNFLIRWLSHDNLQKMCDISLKGNRYYLDCYQKNNGNDKLCLRAHSKGLVGHWVAGNVPILGMISLIQGILTKNTNLLRVSRRFGGILPELVSTFPEIEFVNSNGALISGHEIAKTVSIIHYDKSDKEIGNIFSRNVDVRVVWGGQEAVESITGLERSIDTNDIIFGPKYSFAVVDSSFLTDEAKARQMSQKIAFDISSFEQRGCNSPHTLFIENNGKISIEELCDIIGECLNNALKLLPKESLDSRTVSSILNYRTEYGFTGKVVCSKGTEWTVLYSKEKIGIAEPCFGRTIFLRQIEDITDVLEFVNHSHQSVGLAIEPQRKKEFAEKLTSRGVSRCPDIGNMSLYEIPWDGQFPMENMVRWGSFYS